MQQMFKNESKQSFYFAEMAEAHKISLEFEIKANKLMKNEICKLLNLPDELLDTDVPLCFKECFKESSSVCSTELLASEDICDEADNVNLPSEDTQIDVENPLNSWREHFRGFTILSKPKPEFNLNENRKCVELSVHTTATELKGYLNTGIRCFIIDFFYGTDHSLIQQIHQIREYELNMFKENHFPISSTIIAKLTPRFPYTGMLEPEDAELLLKQGEHLTLTTDRRYSTCSTNKIVYVNMGFTVADLEPCDFVLLGSEIQLVVVRIEGNLIYGKLHHGGILKTRLPVRFQSKRADYTKVSIEEIRDITLAKAMHIKIILTNIFGNKEFYANFKETLRLLHCENMYFYARLVPNTMADRVDCYDWLIDAYDGFILELQLENEKSTRARPELLKLCPSVLCLLHRMYETRKPLLLDPKHLLDRRMVASAEHHRFIFFEPDKFIANARTFDNFNYFEILKDKYMPQSIVADLSEMYCKKSYTGADCLAFAVASTAYEINAAAIIIVSELASMAKRISNFRTNVPIILVTFTKCLTETITVHFNILCIHLPLSKKKYSYHRRIYKSLIFGLKYAQMEKILSNGSKAILVYGMRSCIKFPDKYAICTFDESTFEQKLDKELFDQ